MKLTGNSGMTDVGLFYGLRFLELRQLWLPSADQVLLATCYKNSIKDKKKPIP